MSRLDVVGLAKQGAGFGTKVTTMEYFLPVESADGVPNRTTMSKEETDGTRFPTDIEYGTRFFDVSLAGAARLSSFPRLLSAFFGAPTTTTPGGGVTSRKHAFDPVGKVLVPHSIDLGRRDPSPALNDLFWDAIGNELTLSVEANDWLSYDAALIAKELDQGQAIPGSISYDLSRRLAFHTVTAFISINGGAETALTLASFSATVNNGIDTDQVQLGSRSLYKIKEGNANADLSFTVKSTLDTHYRRALLDADPENVKIRLVATGPIIEGAISYQVEIIVYRCQYLEAPAPVDSGETLSGIAISAHVAYDATATKFIDVNVTNNVTTY